MKDLPVTEWISQKDIETAKAVYKIVKRYGMDLPSLAQRYLFSIQEADRVVMGARTIAQIEHTVADWKDGPLPEEIFEEVSRTIFELSHKRHTNR